LARDLHAAGYALFPVRDPIAAVQYGGWPGDAAVLLEVGAQRALMLETCRAIRRVRHLPVIVLTGRHDADAVRIAALEAGADDALSPPLCPREFVARLAAVARRYGSHASAGPTMLHIGTMTIDLDGRTVTIAGMPLRLRTREFALLATLARRPGVVWSRQTLHAAVCGEGIDLSARAMDAHIRSLRASLIRADVHIRTVWGVGYALVAGGSLAPRPLPRTGEG
jgi:two-component system OmpR family response regulator